MNSNHGELDWCILHQLHHGELVYITELDSCCTNITIFHCIIFEAVKFRNRDSFIEMFIPVNTLQNLWREY